MEDPRGTDKSVNEEASQSSVLPATPIMADRGFNVHDLFVPMMLELTDHWARKILQDVGCPLNNTESALATQIVFSCATSDTALFQSTHNTMFTDLNLLSI